MIKPSIKPNCKNFSSGPCAKHPGFDLANLSQDLLGRSHRSREGKAKLKEVIDLSKALLKIPQDYRLGIIPGSTTGAIEASLWNLLGYEDVTILAWDAFGKKWLNDIVNQLKLPSVDSRIGTFGHLPDRSNINSDNDVVFTWNGTTAGVCMDNVEWLGANRSGLSICDATSAIFAVYLPWEKLDVVTFSWQKCLGGEAAHGMLALSPKAAERLTKFIPDRPIPEIFRLKESNGKLKEEIFSGEIINTPSLLCAEDFVSSLKWAESIGGLEVLIERSKTNFAVIEEWVKSRCHWINFVAEVPAQRSTTSICLKFCNPKIISLSIEQQWQFITKITQLIEQEAAGYDFKGNIWDAPCIRIWGGPTVEADDIGKLLPWIEWAYTVTLNNCQSDHIS